MSKHRNIEIQDIGNAVNCDGCNQDFTESDETGGIMFDSKAIGPCCMKDWEDGARIYNEQDHIRARCPEGMPFRVWVMQLRQGNNQIRITTWEKEAE